MNFIKQCKGKDLDNVATSKLKDSFIISTKYDGNYIQIHKIDNKVKFYTSGGKEFYFADYAEALIDNNPTIDFIIETEYIGNTGGKLGSRGECSTGHARSLYSKGIRVHGGGVKFMVFDLLYYHNMEISMTPEPLKYYRHRLDFLENLDFSSTGLELVDTTGPYNLEECKIIMKTVVNTGYEGLMIKEPRHIYLEGKRVNSAIKLKGRLTADLKCIDVEEGEGKYIGLIGSLVLIDEKGKLVKVGSGLNEADRQAKPDYFIGRTIEIAYEQILDTYIQPVYKCIRKDK